MDLAFLAGKLATEVIKRDLRKRVMLGLKPVQIARLLAKAMGRDLDEEIREHMEKGNGYVVSHPDLFVMGRAVLLPEDKKAWFVESAVGDARKILMTMPFALPYIAFQRRGGNIRAYSTEALARKIINK